MVAASSRRHGPRLVVGHDGGVSTAIAPASAAPGPEGSGWSGSSRRRLDLAHPVWSGIFVLALVAAVIALTPRSNLDAVQVVDWAPAGAKAQAAARFPVLAPVGLPESWRAISARTDVRKGTVHWHLEFETSDGKRVGIEQSDRPAYGFLAEMTERGAAAGLSTVNRSLWVRTYAAGRGHRAIWLRDAEVTTVVGGTGSWQQVEQLAGALRPLR